MKNIVGEKYITKEGYEIEIIEYLGHNKITIIFNDKRGTILKNVRFSQINKRNVENPYHPKTYGIGYMGIGKFYAKKNGITTNAYTAWNSMLRRCYSEKERCKFPTYIGCSVDERWHNFQVFAEWFYSNVFNEGYEVDKDLLVKGNKIYSSETCCLVPKEINIAISCKNNKNRGEYPIGVIKHKDKFRARIGKRRKHLGLFNTPKEAFQVYKIAKEKEIKYLADKHKGKITEEVYQALYTYKVEESD